MIQEERTKIVSTIICANLISINGIHIDDQQVTTVNDSIEIVGTFNNKLFHFYCSDYTQAILSNDKNVLTIPNSFINHNFCGDATVRCFNLQQVNYI